MKWGWRMVEGSNIEKTINLTEIKRNSRLLEGEKEGFTNMATPPP